MEGTRHEKIIIAIAAYVIGFSTAFIAFGVNQVNKTAPSDFSNAYISPVSAQTPVHHMETTVSLAEEGLFAISQERKRILSANRNYLEANVVEALGETGLHYAIIDAEAYASLPVYGIRNRERMRCTVPSSPYEPWSPMNTASTPISAW